MAEITIRGEKIRVVDDKIAIDKLRYFPDNPRVCTVVSSQAAGKTDAEIQELIGREMMKQTSVKNLLPEVKKHGGLVEPVVVVRKTMQVIEGNSRLAVFRHLRDTALNSDGGDPDPWEYIDCRVVDSLTDKQLDAYLSEIHLKGKTKWTAYEQANFAYVRNKEQGLSVAEISARTGITPQMVGKRIKTIAMMKRNDDPEQANYSHYEVLTGSHSIYKHRNYTPEVERALLTKIKTFRDGKEDFKGTDMRDKLPTILDKKKVLQRFTAGEVDLDEAFQSARRSDACNKAKRALATIDSIDDHEVVSLTRPELNELDQTLRKLQRAVHRFRELIESELETR